MRLEYEPFSERRICIAKPDCQLKNSQRVPRIVAWQDRCKNVLVKKRGGERPHAHTKSRTLNPKPSTFKGHALARGFDLIGASIYDKYSVDPSFRPHLNTRDFTMTNMIQVCSNFR